MDFKEFKKLSYDAIDAAIANAENEISENDVAIKNLLQKKSNLEADVKKMREVKLEKMFDDVKPMMVNSKIDLSPDVFQQLLLGKKNDDKFPKQKNQKKLRDKKNEEKKKMLEKTASKNFSQEKNSVDKVNNATGEKLAVEEVTVPQKNFNPAELPVVNKNAEKKTDAVIPAPTDSLIEVTVQEIESTPSVAQISAPENVVADDALNTPLKSEEFFEDADSQPKKSTSEESQGITKKAEVNSQPENSSSKELKVIASYVGRPADASLADVRKAFDVKKNEIPPAIAVNFEQILGKLERGEIA